jgi:hypothetical protein
MQPNVCLQQFLNEMLQWELWYTGEKKTPEYETAQGIDKIKALSHERLEPILKKWLTAKAFETLGQEKLATKGIGRPPIYRQPVEPDYEIKGGKAYAFSQDSAGNGFRNRYSFEKNTDGWKISAVHCSYNGAAWRKEGSV